MVDLDEWRTLDLRDKEALAIELAHSPLPVGQIEFVGIRTFTRGEHSNDLAVFQIDDAEFVLIPGCQNAQLGWDRSDQNFPNRKTRELWQTQYVDKYDFEALDTNLGRFMSSSRVVLIAPFLLERSANVPPIEDPQDPLYSEVTEVVEKSGCRLPTQDELEWAYRGGTDFAFPWGDDPMTIDDDQLLCPNSFGVFPPSRHSDPIYGHMWEFCQQEGTLLGGDGVGAACGGWTELPFRLTFACAYRHSGLDEFWNALVRRCLSVPI